MRYTHFFWDFDGMLFNTYPRMLRAFVRVLRECGIREPEEEVLRRIKVSVRAARDYYAQKYPIDPAYDMAAKYAEYETSQPIETMVPYEGIPEMLRRTKALGATHYLYTHRGRTAFQALTHWGMDGLFADSVTGEDPFPVKPAPDALNHLIEAHGVPRSHACMMGDRDIDIQAGHNAGIAGCLFDPEHFYDGFRTEHRVHSVDQLERWMTGD